MINFEEYVYERIKDKIKLFDEDDLDDIYALSLYISDVMDDPRRPMITLGYNTLKQFHISIHEASDEMEAKWNYAFWLQNQELIIGDNYGENIEDSIKITNWIKDLKLYYSDADEENNLNYTSQLGERITHELIKLCICVVRKLHNQRAIKTTFKKEIPIIIHELEYYDAIAKQNIKANPKKLVKEFTSWINDM